MKIVYLFTSLFPWHSGCWLYRCRIPSAELKNRGHEVQGLIMGKEIVSKWLDYPDVVIFGVYGGAYGIDPFPLIKEYKKRGKKVVYDLDDDLFSINPDNPSVVDVKRKGNIKQTTELLKVADVVTTTTEVLKKRFQKFNENVAVCPNALDFSKFTKRKGGDTKLRIGYTGASSHWGDLSLVMDVLLELEKKYDFEFILQGMCGNPIEAEVYNYQMIYRQGLEPEKKYFHEAIFKTYDKYRNLKRDNRAHIPFYPPEMYPSVLGQANLDIGICPLKDNIFNQAKSCIKFYEYATTGTVTLASNVLPYNKEVGYCAKNKFRDWYRKLEKLIVDKKFREELLKKQQRFVQENRDIKEIVKIWESALCPKKS